MSFPMANSGFFRIGGIPTPEAGVCTPYPIAIPITTDLIHYSSVFNSCDNFKVNDGTGVITATNDTNSYSNDLSSNSNPIYNDSSIPSTTRHALYTDNGGGDVYWRYSASGGTFTRWTVNTAWRFNSTVKTVMILLKTADVSSNLTTRIGFHYINFQARINGGKLSIFDGVNRDSASLTPVNNTWFVWTTRTNNNCVLSLDKTHQSVKATAPNVSNSSFNIWTPNGINGQWIGDMREIAIYSESLSDADVDTMVDYMKDKWLL
jgi:hypothetical protein